MAAAEAWVDYANTFRVKTNAIVSLNLGYEFENGPMVFIDARNVFDERYVSNFTPLVNWNTEVAREICTGG